jgi:hypothetical protein
MTYKRRPLRDTKFGLLNFPVLAVLPFLVAGTPVLDV